MLDRPRLLYFATLLLLLHVMVAAIMKQGNATTTISDSIELLAAVSAAAACHQAAKRSRYLPRAFWFLAGCSFAIWSLGQAYDLVSDDFLHVTSIRGFAAPSSLLIFFLSLLPMFVAVFIGSYRKDETIGVETWLDTLQLFVLVGSIYAFFILIPTAIAGSQATYELRLFVLHLRNIALATGLTCRAIFTRSDTTRRLFAPMAAIMSLFALGTWIGNHSEQISVILDNSYWHELAWTLTFVLVIAAATKWDGPKETEQPASTKQNISGIILVYSPSMLFPVILFATMPTIKRAQIVLALATLFFTLVLFTIRLTLLQARQNRILAALTHSESRYRSLFERNMAGVYRSSMDGRLLDFNPAFARMYGYTREELLNTPSHVLYPGGESERIRRVDEHRKEGAEGRFEVEYVRKDGNRVWVMESRLFVQDENGDEVIEGTQLDVTERHQLEEQFRKAQKMEAVGRLAGGIAHDFNNLLTVISGFSSIQLERTAESDPVHHEAEQIKGAADRAAALTRQLLAFSRQQVLEPRLINLNENVRNLGKMVRRLIGEDIEVLTQLDPALGTVKVDPGQVDQVLMNLAVNARDAMPSGGQLMIQTENVELDESYASRHKYVTPGRYVLLAVSDSGVGIPPENLNRIFEPFFTTKEAGKGTGLGLPMVYGIVKQSGGSIEVYSESSHGTTVKIYLPRVDVPAEESKQPELPRTELTRGSERILLAEDEPQLKELVVNILTNRGYTVTTVEDLGDLEAVLQQTPRCELLLTDIVMPKMSGPQIAKRVAECWPETKVLYMSGYLANAIVHQGVIGEGLPFLQKPFSPAALLAKVRGVLNGRDEDQPPPGD